MNVLVLMSGGFHPFHPGHLALYNSAKKTFPGADVVVGATNVQKDRPFNFKDKATLASIAGVDNGHFVEVNRQFIVKGEPNIEGRIQNPDDTVLIFVRSVKDAKDPALQPWKLNPDGSIPMTKGSKNHPSRPTSNYLLSYKGNEKKLQPMTKHAYIAFLPVEEFSGDMTSATQIRNTWPTLDDKGKQQFAMSLYPATQQNSKLLKTVIDILNRNLIATVEPAVAPATSAIKKLKADKLKEHIQRMRPLLREANSEQKLKLLKLMKVALKEHDMVEGLPSTFSKRPETYREPCWSYGEISQKLGITPNELTGLRSHFGFPEKIDGIKSHSGSKAYFRRSDVKRWVNDNDIINIIKSNQNVTSGQVDEAKIHFTDPSTKVNLYYIPPKLEAQGQVQNVAHNIPYSTVQPLIDRLMQKYPNMNPDYMVWYPLGQDKYGQRLEELAIDTSGDGQGVAEDRENFNGINLLLQKDDEEVFVKASAGGRELGHVLFVMDGDYLMPQDLEVEERYRGQGIAQTMYDFVKSKGYKIRRSGQQTDAGAGFWAKHRPEQNVWEEGVTESNDYLEEK